MLKLKCFCNTFLWRWLLPSQLAGVLSHLFLKKGVGPTDEAPLHESSELGGTTVNLNVIDHRPWPARIAANVTAVVGALAASNLGACLIADAANVRSPPFMLKCAQRSILHKRPS